MSDIETVVGDALADGKITDGDADAVREFADFLRHAGPPANAPGGPHWPLARLREAGRLDLMAYALGFEPVTINQRWELLLPAHRARGDWWDTWERERLASMADHLGDGDVVYYVGAEQGDMPALCAQWGADTVLIEPSPQVWPNMRHIYATNALRDPLACFIGFAGRSDRDADRLTFGWPKGTEGPVSDVEAFCNLHERPDIPVITLNTLATQVAPPTAISIDVEGAELEVLAGAAAVVLTEHRPKVWVSVHPQFMADMYGSRPDELDSLMIGHGYRGTMLADVHEQHMLYLPEEAV